MLVPVLVQSPVTLISCVVHFHGTVEPQWNSHRLVGMCVCLWATGTGENASPGQAIVHCIDFL
jgi:hypothetical protein